MPPILPDVSPSQFALTYRSLAADYGYSHPRLTPHGLRRGGSTWFFRRLRSIDILVAKGRWSSRKIAQMYVDQSMLDMTSLAMSKPSTEAITMAARLLPELIMRLQELLLRC